MDFIFTWLIKVICYLIAIPFDLALNSLGEIFSMDGVAFLAVFGTSALSYYGQLFMPLAYALLLALTLLSIVKGVLGDKDEGSMDAPIHLLVRLVLCFFAIRNALPILQMIRSVFSVAYDWIVVEFSTMDTIKLQLEQVGEAIGGHLFDHNIAWGDVLEMSGLASGTVGLLISTIFLIPVYFRIIRVMITFASRYVLRCVLELVSPLPFACGVSKATSNILSNYLRLYLGILVSTIISAFLLKLYWAGAALLSYNMIHNVARGVLTMFMVMGMYDVFMKVDTYINQIGLHGMAPTADRRASINSIMQTLFMGTGLYKYLKGQGGGLGNGIRSAPDPKGLTPMGKIGSTDRSSITGSKEERLRIGMSSTKASESGAGKTVVARGTTGSSMALSRASSMMEQKSMRSGFAARAAFQTLMPGGITADSGKQYPGQLYGKAGAQSMVFRKNGDTGHWEGAQVVNDDGLGFYAGDYRPVSELAAEAEATSVGIGIGDEKMNFSMQAGETFVTSSFEKGFDQYAAMHTLDHGTDSSVVTDAFGEKGYMMATKVGNNSMQGYYYSPGTGKVEGVKASMISKEEFDHNPKRAVKLNNGTYLRFHKSDPDSAIAKAAASVTFEKGRFVRKSKFSLNPDGSLKEK